MKYYYTSRQIKKRFNWSKQMLSTVARREGWQGDFSKYPRWYDALQVQQYIVSREHSTRARMEGATVNGLIRHNEKLQSDICPVCAMEKGE
jgi:hypothetical protein